MSNTKSSTETVTVGRLTVTSPSGRSASALCFRKAGLCFAAKK